MYLIHLSGESIFIPGSPLNAGAIQSLSSVFHLFSRLSLWKLFTLFWPPLVLILLHNPPFVLHRVGFVLCSSLSTSISSSDYSSSSSLKSELISESASAVTNATASSKLTCLSSEDAIFSSEKKCQKTIDKMMQKSNAQNIQKFGECVTRKIPSSSNQKQQNIIILPPNMWESNLNLDVYIRPR